MSASPTARPDSAAGPRCVVCAGSVEDDVRVRLASGQLRRCPSCETWVHFPRDGQAEQSAIHDTPDYFDHPYFKLRRSLNERQLLRCREIFDRLRGSIDVDRLRGSRMLDIGCDTGVFLAGAAKLFGIAPHGVDVNRRAVIAARDAGVEAFNGTVDSAPAEWRDFPLITAIDLIEHVSSPRALLLQIRDRLCPGGVAYLETPNIRSAVYRTGRLLSIVTGGCPAGLYERLFPPQHIQYFTRSSLSSLVRSCGLEIVEMRDRRLPGADIAASGLIRACMSIMQAVDSLTGERILIWATLRRPAVVSVR